MAPVKIEQLALEAWVAKTQKLLQLDYEEELEQNRILCQKYSLKQLEDSGHAVRRLAVINRRTAFGRQLVQFGVSTSSNKREEVNLTTVGITNGDIVGVTMQSETQSQLSGVVLQVKRTSLEVAFDIHANLSVFDQAPDSAVFNLLKLTNDVTYRRLKFAVDNLYKRSVKTYLIGLLFGDEPLLEPLSTLPPYLPDLPPSITQCEDPIVWFNPNLNDSQKEAIEFALYARHLAVIHGPPGTGKTTTLTEVILQLITRGLRVFVSAPSNVAVDNCFKQLLNAYQSHLNSRFKSKKTFNFVRLGHPARVDSQIQGYSLDALVDSSVVAELKTEMDQLRSGGGQNRAARGEMKEIRQQIASYETKAFKELLQGAQVIMSTLTSATFKGQLKYLVEGNPEDFAFDVVIVDECAQSLEAATWIPLSYARKCILGGDHQQLPATIVSQEAANQGLGVSLLERTVHLFGDHPERVVRMLEVQYRMNSTIMRWPSDYFYSGRLEAGQSVARRRLTLKNQSEPEPELVLIDTTGCDMYELELEDQSLSKGNQYEVDLVCLYLQKLIDGGISASEIGVISPYRLQTSMISARCREMFPESITTALEVNSVDAFQGREKEVIILSLVRSNPQGEIGFLIEDRRLNVAITRARSHLVVVCDSGTVTKESKALESFLDYCYTEAEVITASDYAEQMEQFDELKVELKGRSTAVKETDSRNRKSGKSNKTGRKAESKKVAKKPPVTKPEPMDVQAQLVKFLSDSTRTELKFPVTLNAAERREIHEECERLGLGHQSVGEPPNRQLVVLKL